MDTSKTTIARQPTSPKFGQKKSEKLNVQRVGAIDTSIFLRRA
jgi:hypothetical protein